MSRKKQGISNNLDRIGRNMGLVSAVAKIKDPEVMNAELNKLLNSVRIFYKSKQDFLSSFPDEDDAKGKMKLIISRRS